MNKIGQIMLQNEIKILDAFSFPEEFDSVNLSQIKNGLWLVFNQVKEVEDYGDVITDFFMVEENFAIKNPNMDKYAWEKTGSQLGIEKGVIGIFNNGFSPSENYYEECDTQISGETLTAIYGNDGVFCTVPYGSDGYFSIEVVDDKENNYIYAIRIKFSESS